MAEVDTYCKDLGWRDPEHPASFGDRMAMLHSEVSEAVEAYRVWGTDDHTHTPPVSALSYGPPKPEGLGSEFADVLIRLLDDCAVYGIDLEAEYERKMAYNRTRSYRHGGKAL
jgi:NTP pyrophosphatase (non-canonical NTP hydrolase)